MGLLYKEQDILKVSYKWATKLINCTAEGIVNGCEAKCCRTASYWPVRVRMQENNKCYYLRADGCSLTAEHQPITCHIYPFMIHKNQLMLHFRAIASCCKKCYGHGPMIIQAIRKNLIYIFGEEQYERVLSDVSKKHNSHFIVPKSIRIALNNEKIWRDNNELPQARMKRTKF